MISFRKADLLTQVRLQNEQRKENDRIDKYSLDSLEDHPQIKAIVQEALDKFKETLMNTYEFYDSEESLTGNTSGPGFHDNTDGRAEVTCKGDLSTFVYSRVSPNNEVLSKKIDEMEVTSYNFAKDRFIEQYAAELKKAKIDPVKDIAKINYHDLYELKRGDLAERLSELETSAMDDPMFFYVKIFYLSPSNRHKQTEEENLPSIEIQGGVEDMMTVMKNEAENAFSFSTLSELKTKLNERLDVLIAGLV